MSDLPAILSVSPVTLRSLFQLQRSHTTFPPQALQRSAIYSTSVIEHLLNTRHYTMCWGIPATDTVFDLVFQWGSQSDNPESSDKPAAERVPEGTLKPFCGHVTRGSFLAGVWLGETSLKM